MFYTIYPLELVWEEAAVDAPRVELQVEGRSLVAVPGAGGQLMVERLLSTDPNDYLDPHLQPGAALPYWLSSGPGP